MQLSADMFFSLRDTSLRPLCGLRDRDVFVTSLHAGVPVRAV